MADECKPCEIGSNSLFGRIIGDRALSPGPKITFFDGVDTKARVNILDNGDKEVTFDYSPYAPPSVNFSVSPSVFEVGDTVATATFTLTVSEKSNNVTAISISPDPGITPTVGTNTFTVNNVTGNTAGNAATHTATITDDSGNADVVSSASLNARWRYYQGFSTKTALNETDIKALVNNQVSTGIKAIYGGENTYTLPASAVNQFVYWSYPEGTAGIQSLTSGGFVVPFVVTGTVPVTNAFGVTQNYIVARTANALGSGNIQINMN